MNFLRKIFSTLGHAVERCVFVITVALQAILYVVLNPVVWGWCIGAVTAGLMFDYALETFFHKDTPFWVDIIAGSVLNGITFVAWVIALVINYAS